MKADTVIFHPIEQAPKDGTAILLLDIDGGFAVTGSYCDDRGIMGWYKEDDEGLIMVLATHFAHINITEATQ